MKYKHGHGKTGQHSPTYSTWLGMRSRCHNPNDSRYADYGGRGIEVCKRWDSFANFLADMGERPKGKTLGRLDNNGPYCQSNCEWQTTLQQSANSRRCRFIVWNGERLHAAEWARKFGLNRSTFYNRLRRWGLIKTMLADL